MRAEIDALRASRRRLVLAADVDRRAIERDLHDGVHQHLIALAVTLQLAGQASGSDPAAAEALLDEMRRDVQQALDETALLAQRIYPATVAQDLAALLRSAAVTADVPASVDVAVDPTCPPEVALTVYLCWVDALANVSAPPRLAITARAETGALKFEIAGVLTRSHMLDRLVYRVEALDGRLTVWSASDGRTRVAGSLPLPR